MVDIGLKVLVSPLDLMWKWIDIGPKHMVHKIESPR